MKTKKSKKHPKYPAQEYYNLLKLLVKACTDAGSMVSQDIRYHEDKQNWKKVRLSSFL